MAFRLVLCACKVYECYSLQHLSLTAPMTEWSSIVYTPVLDTEAIATNEKQSDRINIITSELNINDC
jgi:hypothetical protein